MPAVLKIASDMPAVSPRWVSRSERLIDPPTNLLSKSHTILLLESLNTTDDLSRVIASKLLFGRGRCWIEGAPFRSLA